MMHALVIGKEIGGGGYTKTVPQWPIGIVTPQSFEIYFQSGQVGYRPSKDDFTQIDPCCECVICEIFKHSMRLTRVAAEIAPNDIVEDDWFFEHVQGTQMWVRSGE